MVTLVMATTGLAACSRHRDKSLTPTSVSPAPPATSGAVVRVGVPEEPASLNPFDVRSRTMAAGNVLQAVLPQLFTVAPDGAVRGSLVDDATVHEHLPGAVTFSLRRGVKWSDGQAITADDVRFTWEAIRSDQWHGSRAGYDTVTGVEGTARNVTLRFSSALPGWKRLFSGDDYVLPAHRLRGQVPLGDIWAAGPDVAGGPYKLAGVTPGLEVDLDRNENWWGDAPEYARVRVLVVPDGRTMEQLLARGDLDVVAPAAGTNRINRFKAVKDTSVTEAEPGGQLTTLVVNTDKVATARRRSLLAMVDRDRFVAALMNGEATTTASLVPGRSAGPWRNVGVDVAAGKSGLGSAFTVALAAPDSESMAGLFGRAVQTRLQDTSATLELKFSDAAEVAGTWRPTGRFDLLLSTEVQWPVVCWRCRFAADSVDRSNWSRVKSVDELAAVGDRGDGGAGASGGALETKLHDDAVVLPLWRPRALTAARGVRGATANSWTPGPLWNVAGWKPAS